MAKRKLSPEQRAELRADLKKGISSGKKVADVLREVAKKYGITTITARWYLKSIGVKPKRRAGTRGPGRPPGRKPGRPAGGNDTSDAGMLKLIQERSQNAKEANKIAPRWQKLIDKESALRRQVDKLNRRLEATAKKALQLRRRLDALVGS